VGGAEVKGLKKKEIEYIGASVTNFFIASETGRMEAAPGEKSKMTTASWVDTKRKAMQEEVRVRQKRDEKRKSQRI